METMYSLLLAIVMFSSCGSMSADYTGLLSSPEQSVSTEMSPPAPPSPPADAAMNGEASIVQDESKKEGME